MNSERASAGATPRGCSGSKRRSWALEIATLGSHERHESTKDTKKTVTASATAAGEAGRLAKRKAPRKHKPAQKFRFVFPWRFSFRRPAARARRATTPRVLRVLRSGCLFRELRGDAALDAFVSFVVSGYLVAAIKVM